MGTFGWLTVLLLALAALFYYLTGEGSDFGGMGGWERFGLIAGAVLMSGYCLLLLSGVGGELRQALKHLAIWAGVILALVTAYAYRDDLSLVANKVAGELVPPGQSITVANSPTGEAAVRIRRRSDGHFSARARVNSVSLTLLVDTGASTVVLKPVDARRLGIDTQSLSYSIPVQTANGTAYAAPVKLSEVSIGPIVVHDVDTLVTKPGSLNQSLLGMSFLRRLRSYEFNGDFLTLRG